MKYFCLLALVILTIGCSSTADVSFEQDRATLTPIVASTVEDLPESVEPDNPTAAPRPRIYESISDITNSLSLESLHKTSVQPEDIEIRVWHDGAGTRLDGFVLKRSMSQWNANRIFFNHATWNPKHYDFTVSRYVNGPMPRREPRSGWSTFWSQLRRRNLLILPNAASIKCEGETGDLREYVVEIKKGNDYRTYMYRNPVQARKDCMEAEDFIAIYELIINEFDLNTGVGTSSQ